MAKRIPHRGHEIVVLDEDETVPAQCDKGDVAVKKEKGGWRVVFVGEDGKLSSWGIPFNSADDAIKAVIETPIP
jgi:hypothetical protein